MDKPDSREMYGEIANLIGSLAKALAMTDAEVIGAVERGEVTVDFGQDPNGNRFVAVTYGERKIRIYQGAIQHDEPPPGAPS